MKTAVSAHKANNPTATIIIAGYYGSDWQEKFMRKLKKAELSGDKLMNRKIGNQLANEIGAVKYVEYSVENARGIQTFYNEIVFAHLGKLRAEEEERERLEREREFHENQSEEKELEKITREKKQRKKKAICNIFIFYSAALFLIIAIYYGVFFY